MSIVTRELIERYEKNQGYIYLIHAQGTQYYKIGRTKNPVERLNRLRLQSPYPLEIVRKFWTPDAIADERAIHTAISKNRMHGEWFELPNQVTVRINPQNLPPGYLGQDLFTLSTSSFEDINCVAVETFFTKRPEVFVLSTKLTDSLIPKIKKENEKYGEPLQITDEDIIVLTYSLGEEIFGCLADQSNLDKFTRLLRYIDSGVIKNAFTTPSTTDKTPLDIDQLCIALRANIAGFAASLRFAQSVIPCSSFTLRRSGEKEETRAHSGGAI